MFKEAASSESDTITYPYIYVINSNNKNNCHYTLPLKIYNFIKY